MLVEVWAGISFDQKKIFKMGFGHGYTPGKGNVGVRRKWNCGRKLGTGGRGR